MEVTEGLIESDCSDYAREKDLMSPLKFDNLFQEYKSAVYGFAYYLTQNQGEAEDLFQETWLRVVKYLPENMDMRGFKAWVFTVTANLHRDALRKKRVRRLFIWQKSKDLANTSGLSPFMLVGDRSDNSHEMDRVELGMAISRAVANLPSRQRLIFVLKEIEGFKQSEISEILKMPIGTVKSLMYRAVKRLRGDLANYRSRENHSSERVR